MRLALARPVSPVLFRRSTAPIAATLDVINGRLSARYESGSAPVLGTTAITLPVRGEIRWYADPDVAGGQTLGFVDADELAAMAAATALAETARTERAAAQKREDTERVRITSARNRAFNEALSIGVTWQPAFKTRLNMLREYTTRGQQIRSYSSVERNTVVHVLLDAPLQLGRLTRKRDDLLCTGSDHGHEGLRRLATLDAARVTCKACLRLCTTLQMRAAERHPRSESP